MRRTSRALCAALWLAAAPALGAEVHGRVVHADDPGAGAGLPVRLLGLTPDGAPVSRETTTDAQGRFTFADLAAPAAYLTLAEYRGVSFHGETLRFAPGEDAQSRTVEIAIHDPSADPAPVVLERIRIFVEREPTGYRVDQVVQVANRGERVIALPEDTPPALSIALAAGHGPLRTPTGLVPSGFAESDGALELRGPLFPGARELMFSYDLPESDGALRTELVFPDGVPQLELYVLDERLAIDAGGLHPARASRDPNGSVYQRYLGFDLPPGARVPLAIEPLPQLPQRTSPLTAMAAALLAGGLLFFVGRPFSGSAAARAEGAREPDAGEAEAEAAAVEKEALFAALRDLEHDFETGKLSAEDRDALRAALRRDTLAGLARARGRRAAAPPEARRCPGCGRETTAGDNFCAGCGRAL